MWTGWINVAAGIWLIISSFIPALRTPANLIIVGIVMAIDGFSSAPNLQGIVNGIIGIWLFLSGVWFGIYGQWNFLLFGIIGLLLALWNALGPKTNYHPRTTSHTAHPAT